VLHALLDYVVDNYTPVVNDAVEEVDAIEERLLQGQLKRADIERIYELRRELVRLRRVAAPMVEVCSRLRHVELPFIDKNMRPYFKDVLDHVVRVNETIDGLREVLSFAFEAAHLLESSRQGEVSRKFAGWAAILAVPTAIAGIFGMNFDHMPELHWQYGYYLALTLIFGVAAILYWRFRRSGWL
jgi:magnesium transporter